MYMGRRDRKASRSLLQRIRREGGAYLFLLPHLIFFIMFVAAPLVYALVMSFHNWSIVGEPGYIGLTNYQRVWSDARFWNTVKNTSIFAIISVPLTVALGLGLALILNQRFYGKLWPLVAFVSPAFFSSIGVLFSWNWILASYPSGLANYYLSKIGLIEDAISWFKTTNLVWTCVILITAWWIVGFSVLLYLGILQRIPPEQYEAAILDGAGPWARFIYITLPWIRNVMFFDVARHVILAFGLFDQVYILTGGGPAGSTRTMVYYLYSVGFERQQLGRAATISWYIFLIVIIFGLVQLALLSRSVRSAEVE